MASVGIQPCAEAFERAFNEILFYLGVQKHHFLTLLGELFADPCDIDRVVIGLSKLLQKLPAAFYQLNSILHPTARVEFDPRRSPITNYVLRISGSSRIVLLDPFQDSTSQFHNFTASRLQEVLVNPVPGDPIHENLYNITDPALRDSLAQLAQDILDSDISKTCRKIVLEFLRRSGGVPPSLLLSELEQLEPFQFTGFSDLYYGKLRTAKVVIKKPRLLKGGLDKVEILREVILCRQFRHPNLLPFVGVSCDDRDWLYGLVTPFMKYGNIIEFLQQYPNTNRLTPVFQIMKGLQFLHSFDVPVAHRDIKGANVLVKDDLVCCLSDFGLSSIPELSQRSREHAVGTAPWMAPEILAPPERGRLDLLKVDIFALGITIYEIYTGKPSLSGCCFYALYTARVVRREKPRLPPTCPHPFPSFLSELVGMMLEYDPTKRPNIRILCQGIEDMLSPPPNIVTEATDHQCTTEKKALDADNVSIRARAQQLVEREWGRIGKPLQRTQTSVSVTETELPQNITSTSLREDSLSQTVYHDLQPNRVTSVQNIVTPPPEVSGGPCTRVMDVLLLPHPMTPHQVEELSYVADATQSTSASLVAAQDSRRVTSIMQHPRLKRLIIPPSAHHELHNCTGSPASPKRSCLSSFGAADRSEQENWPPSSIGHRVGSPAKRRRRNDHSIPSSPITATGRLGDFGASMH